MSYNDVDDHYNIERINRNDSKVSNDSNVSKAKAKKISNAPRNDEQIVSQYVAKGTYGCVFKPSMSCSSEHDHLNSKNSKMSKVSKIFQRDKDLEDEYEIQTNIVSKIDPAGAFTIKAIDKCHVRPMSNKELFTIQELSKCEMGFNPLMALKQIIYQDGGQDLHSIVKADIRTGKELKMAGIDSPTFDALFWSMRYIFKGLVVLKKKGYVHLDIKPPNLVYSDIANGKVCLIDFGLCTSSDKVYTEEFENIHSFTYPYYPPEFKVYSRPNSPARYVAANLIDLRRISSNKDEYLFLDVDLSAEMTLDTIGSYDPFKVDVYALGATLFEMFNRMPSARGSSLPLSELSDLIRGMLKWNSNERFTPEVAYKKYTGIIDKLFVKPCPPKKEWNKMTSRCRIKEVRERRHNVDPSRS